jgi:FkbM family methyltransferase
MNLTHTVKSLFGTLKIILNHPLNADMRTRALKRWLYWQIGSRLVTGPVIIDFVNDSRLAVRTGMTGATQNIYCGLQEFEEMGFLLHYLSKDDLFVDIGANVGTYTVLSSACIGARTIAVEPIPSSFRALEENITINKIQDIVEPKNIGVGNKPGFIKFTTTLDTVNHVVEESDRSDNIVKCKVDTIDSILCNNLPNLIKVDIEGYELAVIEGAQRTLQNQSIEAIIIEINGNGMRYGYKDLDVYNKLIGYGFTATRYSPFERKLYPIYGNNKFSQNTLFVRSPSRATERCQKARPFKVLGKHI